METKIRGLPNAYIETMLGVEIVDENDKAIDMQEFAKKTSENYRKTARIIKGEK